jgi:hypothetical protein
VLNKVDKIVLVVLVEVLGIKLVVLVKILGVNDVVLNPVVVLHCGAEGVIVQLTICVTSKIKEKTVSKLNFYLLM